MAVKINRALIPLIFVMLFLGISQGVTIGQAPFQTLLFPLISIDNSKWIGPYGGTVVHIAIDPADPQVVYAGSYGSGVFRSLDGGISWYPRSEGLTNLFIYSLVIDPSQPRTIYAGTYRGGLFKSTDGGDSWYLSASGIQAEAIVYDLAIDPVSTQVVYAATRGLSTDGGAPWNGVLYRSMDAGVTWSPVLPNLGGLQVEDWVYSIFVNPFVHNEVLLATHEYGPYRSTNSGNTWNAITNGILDLSGRAIVSGRQSATYKTYYYGTWHVDTVYKTTNSGGLWAVINHGYDYEHVYDIALDPQNENNVYLSTFMDGVLKSTNGGASWVASGLSRDYVYSVAINPQAPNHLLAGTYGDGIYRSDDGGGSWVHSDDGLQNSPVTALVSAPGDPNTLYAGIYGGGVYRSSDLGASWQELKTGLQTLLVNDLVMDPAHPGLLYATTDGGLYKNDLNNGSSWIFAGQGLPLSVESGPDYPPDHPFATLEMQEAATEQGGTVSSTSGTTPLLKMVFAPSNPLVVYVGTNRNGVYRSSDGGSSWHAAGLASKTITGLAVDLANSNLVYAITDQDTSIMVSSNGGQSWTSSSLAATFYAINASPTEAGVVFVGTSKGIYRYQSGTWTSLGLFGQNVTAIQPDTAGSAIIFAGTDANAYYTLDGGQHWIVADSELRGQTIQDIIINPGNNEQLFFSTTTHGIFFKTFQR